MSIWIWYDSIATAPRIAICCMELKSRATSRPRTVIMFCTFRGRYRYIRCLPDEILAPFGNLGECWRSRGRRELLTHTHGLTVTRPLLRVRVRPRIADGGYNSGAVRTSRTQFGPWPRRVVSRTSATTTSRRRGFPNMAALQCGHLGDPVAWRSPAFPRRRTRTRGVLRKRRRHGRGQWLQLPLHVHVVRVLQYAHHGRGLHHARRVRSGVAYPTARAFAEIAPRTRATRADPRAVTPVRSGP